MEQISTGIPDHPGPKAPPPGLTAEQIREIRQAQERGKKIRRAVTVARTDAGITGAFGVMAILSFWLGVENVVVGAALCVLALNSLRGARRLQKFDLAAPGILGMNQVYLAGVIILYALYALHAGLSGNSPYTQQLRELGAGDLAGLERTIYWLVYGGLIVGTIVAQGLTALYYFSRARHLEAYLKDTPQWVRELEAART
jgi:hypothetical protein